LSRSDKFVIVLLGFAGLVFLIDFIYFFNASYLEGRGFFPWGFGLIAGVIGLIIGVVICVICLVAAGIRKYKRQRYVWQLCVFSILSLLAVPISVFATISLRQPGYCQFSWGFKDRVEANCTLEEMQNWFANYTNDEQAKSRTRMQEFSCTLAPQDVPGFVKKIYPQDKNIYLETTRVRPVYKDSGLFREEYKNTILVYWGGPFGHWGIAIGPNDLNLKIDKENFYIKWKPGIYIWHEIQ